MGDFNSHSELQGYTDTNEDEEAVEKWAEDNDLSLVHDPQTSYFNNDKWKGGYNPNIIFVSSNINQQAVKNVDKPILYSQHRLI